MKLDEQALGDLQIQLPTLSRVLDESLQTTTMEDESLQEPTSEGLRNRKIENSEAESIDHIQTILIRHHSE